MENNKKRPIARALHKFLGQNEHELTFSPGEAILLLKRIDDNWLEGELNGLVGIFPANRVRIEVGSPSLSQDSALARSGRPCGVVLHDFAGDVEGDLPLEEGQIVELLGTIAAGWMKGRLHDKTGIFPSSFVEVIQPLRVSRKPVPRPRKSKNSPPIPRPRSRTRVTSQDKPSECVATVGGSGSESSLDVNKTVSALEQDISELKGSLTAEEKMMESTSALLDVCEDETKQMKLSSALVSHKNNVQSYREKLNKMEAHRDSLLAQEVSSPPATPPSPMATTQPDSDSIKRQRIIKELFETERDFHSELAALRDKILPSFKKWKSVKYETIFCNIEEVTELSGKMTEAFKRIQEDKDHEGAESTDGNGVEGVGEVFRQFADQIRNVYGTYCKGQDSASQLLEKLLEDQSKADVIREYFNLGRPHVISWDLHTLLIKPVQRIVKYPLLLENLMMATPPESKDFKALKIAVRTSSQVAQDINEIRRRKDILERYTGSGRDEKRVNFGTLRKKVRRLNQSIVQKTGLRSATVDVKYDHEESKLLALENSLKNLQQNLHAWQDEGQRMFECRDILLSAIALYSDEDNQVSQDCVRVMNTVKEEWNVRSKTLLNDVISPLGVLLGLFHDPELLMSKRRDKLLDYDSLQHDLEKTTEPDKLEPLREQVMLAKRTYEALNTQLLEDLPLFTEKVAEAASIILATFIRHQADLHFSLLETLKQSESVDSIDISSQSIVTHTMHLLQDISLELSKLSIVPSTLGVAFSHHQQSGGPDQHPGPSLTKSLSVSHSKNLSKSPPTARPPVKRNRRLSMPPRLQNNKEPVYAEIHPCTNSKGLNHAVPVDEKSDSEMSDNDPDSNVTLTNGYDSVPTEPTSVAESLDKLFTTRQSTDGSSQLGTTLLVLYDFIAENETELSVCEGERVCLLSGVDSEGNAEWSLVKKQDQTRGYVPSNYLDHIID